jgi:hypothetical protein
MAEIDHQVLCVLLFSSYSFLTDMASWSLSSLEYDTSLLYAHPNLVHTYKYRGRKLILFHSETRNWCT